MIPEGTAGIVQRSIAIGMDAKEATDAFEGKWICWNRYSDETR